MKIRHLLSLALLACSGMTNAADLRINNLANSQGAFRTLSENIGAATSYKGVIPAESMGLTGFDIGVEMTSTKITDKAVWARATGSSAPDSINQTKLHLHKGLPFGIDIGAVASSSTNSNLSTVGGEVRYALVQGGLVMPAIGLRGAYTRVGGVDNLDLDNKSIELTISKGFLMFKPYAGIGHVWTNSKPNGVAGLTREEFGLFRAYAGANVNLGLVNLALELDRTGDASSVSGKFGFRF